MRRFGESGKVASNLPASDPEDAVGAKVDVDAEVGVSVLIPVYNNADNLPDLAQRLLPVLGRLMRPYEIILVNDGSTDASWASICSLSRQHPQIRGIDLMRNFGQHNALLAGIRQARYQTIVTMDDDLQHPPEEIPRLLNALTGHYDVVYGTPESLPHSLGRNIASWITKLILKNVMGAETARKIDAFRAFRTHLRRGFRQYSGPFVSIDVLLTWATNRFTAVTVRHDPRQRGTSGYTLGKLITHTLNMLTGFSTLPLQVASALGFCTFALGIALMAYAVGRYLLVGGAPAGFPFLVSLITLLSGAQLVVLGIIGEYLARAHFRIMDRPPYVVRKKI